MPKSPMFTNLDVMKKAKESVDRKINTALRVADTVPKHPSYYVDGAKYDIRYPEDIAALIVDTSVVPEEQREEYFRLETEKIVRAFFTIDENTKLPYPEAIKPYIKQVYERLTADERINWDSVEDVERLLATEKASQSFATFVTDFPDLIFELFPTLEEIRWLDNRTAKASLICHDARIALQLATIDEVAENKREFILQSNDALGNKLISELGHSVIDARLSGENVIYLDPVASDLTKKLFLGERIEIDNGDPLPYTDNSYAKDYIENLARTYKHTSIEQHSDLAIANVLNKEDDSVEFEYEHLFINGKPVRESIRELVGQSYRAFDARAAAGKMLKNALTDGKSIVTMMQTVTGAGGKTEFRHQEIKVDLDKLNQVDKAETKYSLFRRFLDWTRIYKIQKYKSNEARDAAQEKVRSSESFQNALRAAEERFIDRYNSDAVQKELGDSAIHRAIPKLVKAEEPEKNQSIKSESERIPLKGIELEPNKTVVIEPKPDSANKTLSNDQKTM